MSKAFQEPSPMPTPMRDPFGREIRSLRLSVTQACDLACAHCHREGQEVSAEEMTLEEIERVVAVSASLGVRKVKITGGEPLMRKDIVDVVSRISPLVREVSMTTNGSRLSEMAAALKVAGLARVNVSLHSLDPRTNERMCGVDMTAHVVAGIKDAVEVGLSPVKVNMVVFRDINHDMIPPMMDFCGRVGAVLQLIEYESDRDSASTSEFAKKHFSLGPFEQGLAAVSTQTTINELHRRHRYLVPANGTNVSVEIVRPMHNTEFCANCTRIRVSSDGKLKPCLLDRRGAVDVLGPMRAGATDDELRVLFAKAIGSRRPYWS
jgi:cyclic pyranopterin phosphate synthase